MLEYKAPGVVVESPDVGGNQGGLQRSMSSRGAPNGQNTQLLNGVNVNDPAAQGFAMNYYVPTVIENVEVSTGAQDISVGTGGILINMVTKSGTNSFSGSVLQTYQGEKTQTDNIDDELKAAGIRPNANSTDIITQLELPGRRSAAEEQAVLLRLRQLPGDPRRGGRLPGGRAVHVRADAAREHERSGHDRHPRRRRQDHLPVERRQPVRGLSLEAALRQAESRREQPHHAGIELEGARHVRDRAAVVQPRAEQHRCSSTARSATTTRTSRCTRRPTCSR